MLKIIIQNIQQASTMKTKWQYRQKAISGGNIDYPENKELAHPIRNHGNTTQKKSIFLQQIGKDKKKTKERDFTGGPVVTNLPANAGDTGSIPGLRRLHMLWGN